MKQASYRFATESDTKQILQFIRGLAEYEKMQDEVVATEELLREWIFVFLLIQCLNVKADDSAWDSISAFVMTLAHGGGNFYDGWMKNPESAMISCNDGFRPVLAQLYVANEETFQFFKAENAPGVPGYGYIGSVTQ